MAKAEATKEAVKAEVFDLGEEHLVSIAKAGRKVTPSRFLADVEKAEGTGKAFGIKLNGEKNTTIVSELRRAAKQRDVKIRIWDRTTGADAAEPFIAFKVVDAPPVDSAEAAESE